MGGMQGGMELWAIVPELTLAGLILLLLPLGSYLLPARKPIATWMALAGLLVVASVIVSIGANRRRKGPGV